MEVERGETIFRGGIPMDNSSVRIAWGIYLFFLYFILLFLTAMVTMEYTVKEVIEAMYSFPLVILTFLLMVYIMTPLWMPYLLFARRMEITTEGIVHPSSRFGRWTGRSRDFIPRSEIEVIYPVFSAPDYNPSRYKAQGYTFSSFVLLLNNGKRMIHGWSYKIDKEDRDGYRAFMQFMERGPPWFRDKWSPTPIPTEKELKLIRELEISEVKEGEGKRIKGSDIFQMVVAGISVLLIIYGVVVLLFLKAENDFETVLFATGIASFILGFPPFIIIMSLTDRKEKRAKKARELRDQIELSDRKEREAALEELNRAPYDVDTSELEEDRPFSRDSIEQMIKGHDKKTIREAVKAVGSYSPGRVRAAMLVSTYFFLLSIVFAFDLMSGFLVPVVIVVSSILFFVSLFVIGIRLNMMTIDSHRMVIRDVMADEVRTGKRMLPEDFETPDEMLIRRGEDPVKREKLYDFRKVAKRSEWFYLLSFLGVFTLAIGVEGGAVIALLSTEMGLLLDMVVIIGAPLLSTLLFWLGTNFSSRHTNAQNSVRFVEDWEKRTGKRVLPDDIRKVADKVLRGQ